jgi:hypothetical protein
MTTLTDTVLVWMASPPVGGDQSVLQSWLDPSVPWQIVATAVAGLAFLSSAVSMHAWSGTRKHHDVRSIGRGADH